jgi:arabinan endo-1,5-alpha-L-arabinosidase
MLGYAKRYCSYQFSYAGPCSRKGMRLSVAARLLFQVGAMWVTPAAAWGATSGANGTHDPSRMIVSNGKFYVYSTGGGSKSSVDGLVWTAGPGLFPNGIPQSATSVVSNNEGVWAPDVIYLNNQYYLYYALANSQNACAVGLITSPTLDPTSPNYKWTDHGVVVSNTGSDTYCAIDPCPVLDASDNLWLTWGSGYTKSSSDNTIYLTRLDNTTGLASSSDSPTAHPLEPGHIEASYLYLHGGYYYLFWNSGGCCNGASSTYEIHVARSQSITGPYSASQIFYQSTGSIHGPGQIGIYDQCGASRFTYHYYPDTGGSVLGENELGWSSDGWPTVGASSTTPLTPCAVQGTGGAAASGTGGTTGTGGGGAGAGGRNGSGSGGAGAGGQAGGPPASGGSGGGSGTGGSPGGGGSPGSGGAPGSGGSDLGSGGSDAGGGNNGAAGSSGGSAAGTGSVAGTGGAPSDVGPAASGASGCSCGLDGSTSCPPDVVCLFGLLALAIKGRLARRGRQQPDKP